MSRFQWSKTEDGKEWDNFVEQNRGSSFHMWSWRRVLEGEYSRPLYLVCRDAGGSILAVCPFFYTTGRRFAYLESLPNSYDNASLRGVAGPIIGGRATNTSRIIESLRKSVKFSPFNPVVAMHIKTRQPPIIQSMIDLGFQYNVTFGLFILDLQEKTPDHIWNNGFQKHDRQAIKYYERLGAIFEFADEDSDYNDYMSLQKGSNRFRDARIRFFSKMRLNLGDQLKVALATLDTRVIAGISLICNRSSSTVHLAIIGHAPARNIHSSVTFLNWKIVNWAYEHGFRYVDFGSYFIGTSSDPSYPSYKLKRRFEITLVPWYEFALRPSALSYSIARGVNRALQGGIRMIQPKETKPQSDTHNNSAPVDE